MNTNLSLSISLESLSQKTVDRFNARGHFSNGSPLSASYDDFIDGKGLYGILPVYSAYREIAIYIASKQPHISEDDVIDFFKFDDTRNPIAQNLSLEETIKKVERHLSANGALQNSDMYRNVYFNLCQSLGIQPDLKEKERKVEKERPSKKIKSFSQISTNRIITTSDPTPEPITPPKIENNAKDPTVSRYAKPLTEENIKKAVIESVQKIARDLEQKILLKKRLNSNNITTIKTISLADIESSKRTSGIALTRQVMMYSLRMLLRHGKDSLPVVGRRTGDRDHTTVLHAYRKFSKRLRENGPLTQLFMNEIATNLDLSPTGRNFLLSGEHDKAYKVSGSENWEEIMLTKDIEPVPELQLTNPALDTPKNNQAEELIFSEKVETLTAEKIITAITFEWNKLNPSKNNKIMFGHDFKTAANGVPYKIAQYMASNLLDHKEYGSEETISLLGEKLCENHVDLLIEDDDRYVIETIRNTATRLNCSRKKHAQLIPPA